MRKIVSVFFFLLIFAVACSNSEPAIVKVDTPAEDVTEQPELVEEVTDNEQIDEFIEFKLDDEVLRVNLKQIPILSAYLHAVEDRQQVIEKMDIQHIVHKEGNDIYLLEFSCFKDQCSYLLLDQHSENTGFLVADLATFETFTLSPEESKLLLLFNRETTQEYPLSNIVIMDIEKWVVLPLESETMHQNLLDFNWPIFSASWIDEESLVIAVPDTVEANKEQSDSSGNPKINEVIFTIENP